MSAARPRVLIVDDDSSFAGMLSDFLDGRGCGVETAVDGLEGFRRATRENFDLVTIDINMPGVNGVEALRSLKLVDSPASIVVISGFLTEKVILECREAGADEVMRKPVELSSLGLVIDGLLGGRGDV